MTSYCVDFLCGVLIEVKHIVAAKNNVYFKRPEIEAMVSNESTTGADASVEALKLYDMKLLTLAY